MIAFVHGRVDQVAPEAAVVEVGGVGIAVQCTPTTLSRLRVGENTRLPTSLVVREDSLTLYGFADDDERTVFELLQTASGIGPRLAQAMLAVHSPEALRRAFAAEDTSALIQVPGIGKKGAQRIILELRDRLGSPGEMPTPAGPAPVGARGDGWRGQLQQALVGLGWSAREADDALAAVAGQAEEALSAGGQPDIAALLRSALRSLNRS